MTQKRIAYLPLTSYPEAVPDESILSALRFVASLGCSLHATTFAVDIPKMSSPLGRYFLNVPELVRAAEERSKAECTRLHDLVQAFDESRLDVSWTNRTVVVGGALHAAAAEARYYDLAILPWSSQTLVAHDMAQTVVFESGRPGLLVPPAWRSAPVDHIAIAWDASRVAARALADALPLLRAGGRVSVLTVRDEKPLGEANIAGSLAAALKRRGINARPVEISLDGRSIAEALQSTAIEAGAQVLAMGGFGHSRLRDFILGGATNGVLTHLRMPILLSH
jgi:nucleotide-binding universal stress UspA family protein